ncbi:MAG: hypothetical protein HY898_25410 [Deltaproteobacteria bacterium]|nr:hypothetical protein [Deltaproteobacteria bacterium]
MSSRRLAPWVCLCAWAAFAWGCGDWSFADLQPDDPRLLDRACPSPKECMTTGSAQQTTGITADTNGYKFGPGAGTLRIPMQEAPTASRGPGYVDALVAGRGQFYMAFVAPGAEPNAPRVAIPGEYTWMRLNRVTVPEGVSGGQHPEMVIGVDDGSELELADIRASGFEEVSSCALVRVRPHGSIAVWIVALACLAGAVVRRTAPSRRRSV